MKNRKKVIVIGLDCATPQTLFEDFLEDCPNIKMLMENGVYGKLRSSDPPITVPAWFLSVTVGKSSPSATSTVPPGRISPPAQA